MDAQAVEETGFVSYEPTLALGRGSGLADVDAVDLEKVVDRFFDMLQEPATAVEWSR